MRRTIVASSLALSLGLGVQPSAQVNVRTPASCTPAVSDHIAFVYADDLWVAASTAATPAG